MKKALFVVILLVFSSLFAQKIRLAVFNLQNNTAKETLGPQLAEIMRVVIPDFDNYSVIDAGIMRANLKNKKIDFDSLLDSGTAFDAVQSFQTKYFVVGDIGNLENRYSLNIKLVDSTNGEIVKAAGVEFKEMSDIREVIRGLLGKVLEQNNLAGKPVITLSQYEHKARKKSRALSYSILSLSVQASIIGGSALLPPEVNKFNSILGLCMAIPPMTVFYTKDWDAAPFTVGLSVTSGLFMFVGSALSESSHYHDVSLYGRRLRGGFGIAMILGGGFGKIFSVVFDVWVAPRSVVKANKKIREDFYISSVPYKDPVQMAFYPVISPESAGLTLALQF